MTYQPCETYAEAFDRLHGEMLALAETIPWPFRARAIAKVNDYCAERRDYIYATNYAALIAALEEWQ